MSTMAASRQRILVVEDDVSVLAKPFDIQTVTELLLLSCVAALQLEEGTA